MATVTAAQRKMFAKMGIAMSDGSYYVRNASDLHDAIMSVGRGENAGDSGTAIRRHIIARASSLKLSDQIPDTWNSDGSLKHEDLTAVLVHALVEAALVSKAEAPEIDLDSLDRSTRDYIEHFGIKGMRWGERKDRGDSGSHVSEDHAKATELKKVVSKHGTAALSNNDLKLLVDRQNLESQHSRLNPEQQKAGEKFLKELLGVGGSVGKQQATTYGNKYAAKAIEAAIAKAVAKK
jgi:hypothetical protein